MPGCCRDHVFRHRWRPVIGAIIALGAMVAGCQDERVSEPPSPAKAAETGSKWFPDRDFALRYYSELGRVINESGSHPQSALQRAKWFVGRHRTKVVELREHTERISTVQWERILSDLVNSDPKLHGAIQRYQWAIAGISTADKRTRWHAFHRQVLHASDGNR